MKTEDIAIHFADRLCRAGEVLTQEESDMLVQVVQKHRRRIWTAADDRELSRLSRFKMTPAHVIADQLGRTPHAVRTRIRDLKRRNARG